MVDGEVNELSVHQDLDQSPEKPKTIVCLEEGKQRFHLTFLLKVHSIFLHFSIYVLRVHLCFKSCLKPRCMILRTPMIFY
jgi:hypothetical protein